MSVPKFEHPQTHRQHIQDSLKVVVGRFRQILITALMIAANHTLGRLARAWAAKKVARGETIWLDDLPGPPISEAQKFKGYTQIRADLSPNTHLRAKKSNFAALQAYPLPKYPFSYREPPLSSFSISGLGETEKRRPRHLFFGVDYAWQGLMKMLLILTPTDILDIITMLWWDDRRRWGTVASERQNIPNQKQMTEDIKTFACASGAALVGVTEMSDEAYFEEVNDTYKYAISVALPMKRSEMAHAPTPRSHREVQQTYREVGLIAIKLAEHIRSLGYPALACTNIAPGTTVVLHVPIAIQAGLGQLGKHGSMITKEFGSNVRLATVLTDLPLIPDAPVDIGVDDFCLNCQICTTNCPPQAIFETKQVVRGEEKWYVNFDKCVPYFVANQSCGICIEVCPWSEPGRGSLISEKMLSLRGLTDTQDHESEEAV